MIRRSDLVYRFRTDHLVWSDESIPLLKGPDHQCSPGLGPYQPLRNIGTDNPPTSVLPIASRLGHHTTANQCRGYVDSCQYLDSRFFDPDSGLEQLIVEQLWSALHAAVHAAVSPEARAHGGSSGLHIVPRPEHLVSG